MEEGSSKGRRPHGRILPVRASNSAASETPNVPTSTLANWVRGVRIAGRSNLMSMISGTF